MIYLALAVAFQFAAGTAFTCVRGNCSAVPDGLAGVYFLLALLALSLVSNLLLTWRGLPLRRVWFVGCLGSAAMLSIYGGYFLVELGDAGGAVWGVLLFYGLSFAAGTAPLWSTAWLGLLVGEILRRASAKKSVPLPETGGFRSSDPGK